MQIPFGFAPLPIIHNFEGGHPGAFLRSSHPNAERASLLQLAPRAAVLLAGPVATSTCMLCAVSVDVQGDPARQVSRKGLR